jgi:hypothetical protein
MKGYLKFTWRAIFLIAMLYWEYLMKYPKEVLSVVLPINTWDMFDMDEQYALRGAESSGMVRIIILDDPKHKTYGWGLQHMA